MKISTLEPNRSSFLSVEKDFSLVIDKMLGNQNLMKLLYYNTEDALEQNKVTEEQKLSMINKNIRIVPKISIDSSVLTYIIISFDNFVPNDTNPEFRDNIISIDIICHLDKWQLKDFQLRPYRIAAEIDSMLDNKKLSGIGKTNFIGCNQLILNEEFAGVTLIYSAVHGEDDKVNPLGENFG